jgi:hypothetical protein
MTVKRSIPASLAPLLTELELDRPAVVTLALLDELRLRCQVDLPADEVARRLRMLGWLLPLRTRGAWEFAPAERAGAISGGDPFLEFRAAQIVRRDLHIGAGYESAAFLQNLASRQPGREVIVCDVGTPAIRSLDQYRRVDLTLPDEAYSRRDGLRVQTETGLLAALAIRPDGFRDWPGLSEWLQKAARRADPAVLEPSLHGRSAAAWARAAYLLRVGGNAELAGELLKQRPTERGPFYLGPRRGGGHHDRTTDVVDTVVARYAEAGQGRS